MKTNVVKKAYHAPRLEVYGDLKRLTKGGGGGGNDHGFSTKVASG